MPKLAQEAHVQAMEATVCAALKEACIGEDQLEGVAVTIGPGLSLCLQASSSTQHDAAHGIRAAAVKAAWMP